MEPFATYVTRIHSARSHALEAHWRHHKPLCLNGVVSVDQDCWNSELIQLIESLGLSVLRHPESSNFDAALKPLEIEGNVLKSDWFLSLDSDEYIPPKDFGRIARSVGECERNGYTWLRGWLCDRVARGGHIVPLPDDCSYGNLNKVFCVATDATKKIQGSSNIKCFLSKKPILGSLHHREGIPHSEWFRIDHFKWHGDIAAQLVKRAAYFSSIGMNWANQYQVMADHISKHGRICAESCLSTGWESIHGWFDYWDVYYEAVDQLIREGRKSIVIEVGVWHGKSAFYLTMLARARDLDCKIHLVDNFAQAAYIGTRPKAYASLDASFIAVTVNHLESYGLNDDVQYLQCDSAGASRLFDDESCDFVFIDAQHTYADIKKDLLAWLPKMRKGGMLAGHDYDFGEVRQAVHECLGADIRTNHNGKSWIFDVK